MPSHANIVFFDGVCNLCNQSVQWIIDRDRNNKFSFSSLQSPFAEQFFQRYQYTRQSDSVIFWDGHKFHEQSSAALRIAQKIGFPWNMATLGLIIPPFIRDAVYRFIARNRYRWFGKKESCMIPSPDLLHRFLEEAV